MDKKSLYIGRLVKVEGDSRKYSEKTFFEKDGNLYKDLRYGKVYAEVKEDFYGNTIGVDSDTLEQTIEIRNNVSKGYVKKILRRK